MRITIIGHFENVVDVDYAPRSEERVGAKVVEEGSCGIKEIAAAAAARAAAAAKVEARARLARWAATNAAVAPGCSHSPTITQEPLRGEKIRHPLRWRF